jgi:outer membrane receptor protein involved in Fe transport
MNNSIVYIDNDDFTVDDFDLKQQRSWTSIAGLKAQFPWSWSVSVEAYFKYLTNVARTDFKYNEDMTRYARYYFDGEGRIWGVDLMLQKQSGRFWDGWLSYSFNVAQSRYPTETGEAGKWAYPGYHRFHNLNLVLNIKPVPPFNILVRAGLASGALKNFTVSSGASIPFPVFEVDTNGKLVEIAERWVREKVETYRDRDGFALPLDVKFSWNGFNIKAKSLWELYVSIENMLWFVKTKKTGNESEPAISYSLPMPIPSVGFKWSW